MTRHMTAPVLWHYKMNAGRSGGLKGPRSQTSAHADCSLRRYLFCTGKKSAIVCTRTHRGAERTGWGMEGGVEGGGRTTGQPIRRWPADVTLPKVALVPVMRFYRFFFFKPILYLGFIQSEQLEKKLRLLKESLLYSIKATVNNLIMT